MKSHVKVLLALATFALTPVAMAANFPQPTGQYEGTTSGSFTFCFNSSFQEVACGTAGEIVVPSTLLNVGYETFDKQGNICAVSTGTISDLPVNASPPQVLKNVITVSKVTDYDPSTGAGDATVANYVVGDCHGATFDNPTGATPISTGAYHFVVSQQGKRIDEALTQLTDPVGGVGDFSISAVLFSQ